MQTRFYRICGTAVLSAVILLFVGNVCRAQDGAVAVGAQGTGDEIREDKLFGLTLLKSTFRDVLAKFGQPHEIQGGGPFVPLLGAPTGPKGSGAQGSPGGGAGGPGATGAGGGKRATSTTGFPGQGGSSASSPAAGGPGGSPMSNYSGYPGSGGGKMGSLPGFGAGYPGAPGGQAAMGGPGTPGGQDSGGSGGPAGGGGDTADQKEGPETEATWWYHDGVNSLHKSFLFNKDGVLIQIQEYGSDIKHKGDRTRHGVGLGSGLGLVIHNYGWSADGAHSGSNVIMRYGGEYKVAFQLVRNSVVGITVGIVK